MQEIIEPGLMSWLAWACLNHKLIHLLRLLVHLCPVSIVLDGMLEIMCPKQFIIRRG